MKENGKLGIVDDAFSAFLQLLVTYAIVPVTQSSSTAASAASASAVEKKLMTNSLHSEVFLSAKWNEQTLDIKTKLGNQ